MVSAATLSFTGAEADTFKFRDGRGQALNVTLDDADATIAMTWPETGRSRWDTALLGVGVNVASKARRRLSR